MARRGSTAILNPNKGIYYDRSELAIPDGGLIDGFNFRVFKGKITNENLGWVPFGAIPSLNGPVTLIDNFILTSGAQRLIFGTPTDLYLYDEGSGLVSFITPRYATGTASANGTAVTGVGTAWLANAKTGDEISFGSNVEDDPAATWFTILSVDTDVGITLTASAGVIGSGNYTIRQKFVGTFNTPWETTRFYGDPVGDDLWLATNGVDYPVRWNGSGTQVTVNDTIGFKCKRIVNFKNMIIYGNLLMDSGARRPADFINSQPGAPEDVLTGLSSQFRVHGGVDELTNVVRLGDYLAFYSSSHVVVAQFVGDPLVFIFRTVVSDTGALASGLVADFGDYHHFLAADSQALFDGMLIKETSDHFWREYLRQRDPSRAEIAFNHFDDERGELIWAMPLTTDAAVNGITPVAAAAVEHYLEETGQNHPSAFSRRSFPFTTAGYFRRVSTLTWDQLTGQWQDYQISWNDQSLFSAFPITLVGDANGDIWELNGGQTANGTLLPFFVRFGRRALGDGRIKGLLSRVYPFVEERPGNTLQVNTYYYDNASGDMDRSESNDFDLALPEGQHFVTPYRRGRFVEIEFATTGTPAVITGYDVDIRKGGSR